METRKTDWGKNIFIILVIILSYKIGRSSKHSESAMATYDYAAELVEEEIKETKRKIAESDSLILELNKTLNKLQK